MSTFDSAITHYHMGSVTVAWLRAAVELESACDFPAAPPQPIPVPALEAA